jgi:hypothetical protein
MSDAAAVEREYQKMTAQTKVALSSELSQFTFFNLCKRKKVAKVKS